MFNVVRDVAPPKSLENKKNYNGQDVHDALGEIFFNKCYLCETKEPHDINVDHFDAHGEDLEKKFDWNNLYLACSRCNNIKGAKYNNLIDCCDAEVNVFKAIKHLPPRTPHAGRVEIVSVDNDSRSNKTKELLDEIFNSEHTVNKRVTGAFLRKKVFKQYVLLLKQVNYYYCPAAASEDKGIAIKRMQVLIDKSSAYSAFIRWCILDDEKLRYLVEECVD